MNIFTNFFKANQKIVDDNHRSERRELLRRELDATKGIFGETDSDKVRDFFCVDETTWIWYEEWTDSSGSRKHMTTRYEVRQNEIAKSHNGGEFKPISLQELSNFKIAVDAYVRVISKDIYAKAGVS